jgi:hypothetical protein
MKRTLSTWLTQNLEVEPVPGRDLFEIARYLIPMQAKLMKGRLVASGIPAVLADEHLMQAHLLLGPALGGVRILVPASYIVEARAVLEAYERGEFELDGDADVGPLS